MAIKVTQANPLSDYQLAVRFSDGSGGTADFSKLIERKPYLTLKDPEVFAGAIVDHGAVEWPEGDVGIATEALYAMVHDLERPTTLGAVRANELTVSLRQVRQMVGETQASLAANVGLSQAALSQFESGSDHKISAIRRYVEALGGQLEITAVFGDKRLGLKGI